MTALSREVVRDEIEAALIAAIAGTGKPVSSVYAYQKAVLDGESPVVLILSGGTQRTPRGLGAKKFDNTFEFEMQVLVYNGQENNPLNERQREDKVDQVEAVLAQWFVDNQKGVSYRAVRYTSEKSKVEPVIYIDGNPYLLERIPIEVEAPDP